MPSSLALDCDNPPTCTATGPTHCLQDVGKAASKFWFNKTPLQLRVTTLRCIAIHLNSSSPVMSHLPRKHPCCPFLPTLHALTCVTTSNYTRQLRPDFLEESRLTSGAHRAPTYTRLKPANPFFMVWRVSRLSSLWVC